MNKRLLFEKLSKYQVIIMCGLQGSGKSYWARKISSKLGATLLSTDKIRMKKIFPGMGQRQASIELGIDDEEYIGVYRKKIYKILAQKAVDEIKGETKVVLDGSFLDEKRDLVLEEIKKITKKVVIVVVRSPKETIFKRCKQGKRKELERVYSIWEDRLRKGSASYPSSRDGVEMVEIENN